MKNIVLILLILFISIPVFRSNCLIGTGLGLKVIVPGEYTGCEDCIDFLLNNAPEKKSATLTKLNKSANKMPKKSYNI